MSSSFPTFRVLKTGNMKLLEGKVALVTGASRGIGKAIAKNFVENGAIVCFSYASSDEKAREVEAELSAVGGIVKGFKSNAADFTAAQELVDSVVEEFGTLDILVNNAGITRDNLLMRMTEEQWDEIMQVNLKSVFNLTKASLRTFMKARKGSIINISSVVGLKGNSGQANYAASKAGILGFSKSVALEFGSRNIRCNAIAPGFIETDMTGELDEKTVQGWREIIPLKRGGTPEEVANLALFLASDLSTYITRQTISVDGGMLT
ncbi:MAG: 3-oxoacyl-[acyl-carrier protein] reductase [Cryomorphaceae bacterium]|jgi:3-oxoacyl-[acyl-carrier protein] reductase